MANIVSSIKIHLKPTIYLTIDGSASRPDGERSNQVKYDFSYSMSLGSGSYYGKSNAIGLRFNVDGTSHLVYIIGNNSSGNSGSTSFTTTNTNKSGSSGLTIDVWCHQGTYASPTGENCNCTASSGSSATYFGQKSSPYYGTISGVSLSYTPYNPYSAPSIWLNPDDYTKIGVVGKTSYNVHYSLYSGTNGLNWTRSQLFNYDSKSHIWYQQHSRTSSSDGYWDSYVLPTSKFSHGSRYRLAMSTYDGTTEVWSPNNPASGGNGYIIYTYQEPKINTSISRYNNSKC